MRIFGEASEKGVEAAAPATSAETSERDCRVATPAIRLLEKQKNSDGARLDKHNVACQKQWGRSCREHAP
ncbi:hypothetical protein TNCV_3519481 [Trichonephila clavipes]|uniref:Uncharacterized protein n=1 Tax=Trichonephila clavipes TaxID=2585209 RepID=A0A8X6STV2_TRICX|nr:hypothetical protein TNCV_3519481 [Trichonephila clavipes]